MLKIYTNKGLDVDITKRISNFEFEEITDYSLTWSLTFDGHDFSGTIKVSRKRGKEVKFVWNGPGDVPVEYEYIEDFILEEIL
jgi:hypothetical protein